MRLMLQFMWVWLSIFVVGISPAIAHPHIWIEARTIVHFDANGAVDELRHQWTFDEAFSAWMVQGLDVNNDGVVTSDELQELVSENLIALQDFEFYTFAGEGDENLRFIASEPRMAYENGEVVQTFVLTLDRPFFITQALELEVTDPEYYVAFEFAKQDAVILEGAPEHCSVVAHGPQELPSEIAERLAELTPDQYDLPEELKAAVKATSNFAVITCAGVQADKAVSVVADKPTRRSPFAAPATEPALTMPKTGFLGWVDRQQKAFYRAMTGALSELTRDGRAFWTLGGLAFLYGVFHAAGPGHGKIVISSYALANQAQLRKGIVLSFAAAMMQSLVAVTLVLVLAAMLNMTSSAMSAITGQVSMASYILIVLLGVWLIVRKLFGWGHHHDGGHEHGGGDHHDAHAHEDQDDHCHHHVAAPNHQSDDWRGALGVVLAVGLRPCSGALIVLVFALSQGVLWAGVAATFLMGLGTAISVSILASAAVGAKALAGRMGGLDSALARHLVWWLELLGALLILAFGIVLVLAAL